MNVLISGAGITGIVSALHCHGRGLSCELHESTSTIGGILRDWLVDDDWYFRNCQYLTPGSAWFKLLPQNSLFIFPHATGSYTDLWGEPCALRGFAGPVYSSREPPGELNESSSISLIDRLNLYPAIVSTPLIEWVKRFLSRPEIIHSSGAFGLQISRIFLLHFAKQTQAIKAVSRTADELYGLPRHYLGLGPALSALPMCGYSDFFRQIERQLFNERIPLALGSFVRPNILTHQSVSCDNSFREPSVVWTGSPVPLVKSLSSYTLDAPSFKMRNVLVKWLGYCFAKPFYIQVYSKHFPITRIFVYLNKATIECFCDGSDASEIVVFGLEILKYFFGGITKPFVFHECTERRYFLCTIKDYSYLEQFVCQPTNPRLIPAQWHVYGRDSKLTNLMESINKHFPF